MREFDSSPPFHKAILESGATTARSVLPPTHALHEEQFEDFIAKLGCNFIPKDQLIDALRKLNAVDIRDASEDIFQSYNPSIRWPFQPVIDGIGGMVPGRPIDAWESGKWNKVPILTGFNTNEGAMFVPKSYQTDKEFIDFFHTLLPGLPESDLTLLSESYPDPVTHPASKYVETREGFSLGAQFKRMEQAYAHFAYIAPVRQTARFASASGAPVYLYHFSVNSSVVGGADHGNQNDFSTYNKEIRDRSESLEEVSGSMHAYWTSFITTYALSLFVSFLHAFFSKIVLTLDVLGAIRMPSAEDIQTGRSGLLIRLMTPS
jgi:acetylcholinesterase